MRFALGVMVSVAALAGCFSPREPACAFACGPGGACPTEYVCGGDDLCHRADGVGVCLLPPQNDGGDAGDASPSDGGPSDGDASDGGASDGAPE